MSSPPLYPEPGSTPQQSEVWSMPALQRPAGTPPSSARPRAAASPWAWEDPKLAHAEEGAASIPPQPPVRPRKPRRGPPQASPQRSQQALTLRSVRQQMILMLLLGLVIGATIIGVFASAGLLPRSTANADTANTPVPLSSIVYSVLQTGGDTVSCVDPENHTALIHTTSMTTIQREGVAAEFKDIMVGMRINVQGVIARDGSIFAERIAILDPAITGQITVIEANNFRVALNAQTTLVIVSPETEILDAKTRQPVLLSRLLVGQTVQVYGSLNPGGWFDALIILV